MPTFFIIEGMSSEGRVSITLADIGPETALRQGKRILADEHGKVRNVTVRYAAGTLKMGASDFVDPNRTDEND